MTDTDLSYDLIRATDTDPDQYARALELAQPRQAPPLAVLSNLSEAERLEKIDRLRSVIGDAPKLQQALKEDPNLLYLSTDSIQPLSALEKVGDVLKSTGLGALRVPGQIAQGGYEATAALGDQAGRLVYQVFNGPLPEASEQGSPDAQWLADAVSRARQAEERRRGMGEMPGFDFIKNTLESIDARDVPAYRRNIATDIGQAGGNLVGQAAAGLGFGELFGTLSLLSQGYQQGVENAQESGVYGTARGDAGSLLTAGVTGASEKVGLDLLTRPLAKTGVAGRLTGLALGATGEGLSEGVEQFGQNLVQRYVMGDQSVDPFDDVGYNAFLGIVTGGLFKSGIEAAQAYKDRADATLQRNQSIAQGLTEVMNSPFGKRSPDAARALAGQLLSSDPDATFTLPAEQARQLFQSDDAVTLPEEVRADLDRKITAALASGADIDIPIAFLAHAAQAGKIDQVLQHARFDDADLTGAEAQQISLKDIGEEGKRLAQALLNSIQPEQEQRAIAAIRDDIAQQLEAIGTAPDVAAQYAEVEANRLLTRAARRGVDVETMYRQKPITITGELGDITVGGRTLQQSETEQQEARPDEFVDERAVENLTEQVDELGRRQRALAAPQEQSGALESAEQGRTLFQAFRPKHFVDFTRKIDEIKEGRHARTETLHMGDTPQPFRLAGMENLPLVYKHSEAAKTVTGKHADKIDMETLRRLPDLISDPIMVMRQENGRYAALIQDAKGQNVVVVVAPGVMQGRTRVNLVVTTHPKGRADAILKAIADGRVAYRHKERSQDWLGKALRQLQGMPVNLDFKGNVRTEADIVKPAEGSKTLNQPDGSGGTARGSITFYQHRNHYPTVRKQQSVDPHP